MLFTLAVILALAAGPAAAQDMIDVETGKSVPETSGALVAAIDCADVSVIARIDHQANAAGAGMTLGPITEVIFGNPRIGTQIMQAGPRAGLLLPQMVPSREDAEGQVRLSYLDPEAAFAGLEVPGEALNPVRGALEALTPAPTPAR